MRPIKGPLIPKAAFDRIVRDVAAEENERLAGVVQNRGKGDHAAWGEEFRFQPAALQEATEAYVVNYLTGSHLCARHRQAVPVTSKDLN